MSRCSRVCGMTESSAATTSIARSSPEAPASMFRMNRSCPGTSTRARRCRPSSRAAKPRSMEIPRCRSAGKTVGVDPRQGAHQRGLAVIDVACRAQDEVSLIRHGGGSTSEEGLDERPRAEAKVDCKRPRIVEYTGSGIDRRGEIRGPGPFLAESGDRRCLNASNG